MIWLRGKNSLRFEPRDERGLKYALIRLIEDENLRNKLSIMGLDTARKFTWEISAKKILDIVNLPI